ncbi:helix-turn-helix domain-containing protein [Streptomyces sp. NPDC047070]|uniref:PucR family transcriptional regulator n=1 Tax=Streptomyces sp. NPDC047070 TaxID=3154923 RepID=UPI003452860D
MRDIFDVLEHQVTDNARNAVEMYAKELPEYQRARSEPRLHDAIMEFAVSIRRRTISLAREGVPLSDEDLSFISSIGQDRGAKGFSESSQQNALTLHTSSMLREISEAPATHDMDGLLRMVNWFSAQAGTARGAYVLGFEKGRSRALSAVARVQACAKMLLADDPTAPDVVRNLGLPSPGRYAVTVLRFPASRALPDSGTRAALLEPFLLSHRVPMLWRRPEEFVALVPADDTDPAAVDRRVLSLARDLSAAVGLPCAVGTATGAVSALAEAARTAHLVSRAAPVARTPDRACTAADVFVEMGLVQLPELDDWLRGLTRRLAEGPDLVATLDAYYRADMNRLRASAALHVHPRTLDYRLRRVRALTGVDPGSTRGVRLLSAAVTRVRAGAWG